jgi:hypothetical protein
VKAAMAYLFELGDSPRVATGFISQHIKEQQH